MENVLGFGGYCLGGKDNYECFEYYNFFYVCCKIVIFSNCLYRVNLLNNVLKYFWVYFIFLNIFFKEYVGWIKI